MERIGVGGATAAITRHMAERKRVRRTLKAHTKEMEKKHSIEVFPWDHMVLAMEFWRRLNHVPLKAFREKKTAAWVSLHNTYLSLGDYMLERENEILAKSKGQNPHRRIQGLRLDPFVLSYIESIKTPKNKAGRLRFVVKNMGEDMHNEVKKMIKEANPEMSSDAIRHLYQAIASGVSSANLEKEYGWDTTQGQYDRILYKKTYGIALNFLRAASKVHTDDNAVYERAKKEHGELRVLQTAYADDLQSLHDYKHSDNRIADFAGRMKEKRTLDINVQSGTFTKGDFRRLQWIKRRMPRTYDKMVRNLKFDRVNKALAELVMLTMAYDDINDLEEDYRHQPNLVVTLSKEANERKKLAGAIKHNDIPRGKARLKWLKKNLPKTMERLDAHMDGKKKLSRQFFTDDVLGVYGLYVMSKQLKKMKLR